MKKIAVFTGTRAEYGLLYWLMKDIEASELLKLHLYVGGMHLSHEFGYTIDQIYADGFEVAEKVEFLLSSDTPVGISKSMALAIISASEILERNKPDLLILLGDRFESLAFAQAAMIARVPIAHIHGGETTEGLIDEAIRHSITKMSHLHFTATEEYRGRVIQLGEQPDRVFNVGAPGVDSINKIKFLSKKELEQAIDFKLDKPFMMITYHPVTLNKGDCSNIALKALLRVLEKHKDYKFIITYPNADTDGRTLIEILNDFKSKNKERVKLVQSLGQVRYLSLLKYCNAVVGNSSSGLIEAPSMNIPTVNIGTRQSGRICGGTVISCNDDEESISAAINIALSKDFLDKCKREINPYGHGDSSKKILGIIEKISLEGMLMKKFYDVME